MPTGFAIGSVDHTDIDLSHGVTTGYENEEILAASASATEWGAAFVGQVLTLTHPTNSANGDIAVRDEGNAANPGLYNNSASYLIGSANAAYDNTDTLASGTEGYGIQSSSGDAIIDARYDQTGDNVGGLEITDQNLATYNTTMTSDHTVTIVHKVAIASFSASGSYIDTVTYIATANY